MKRAAIYARYSSDRQSAASIDDQVRLCRGRILAEGDELVEVYRDAAISGAATVNRPGLEALLQDAKAGRFDLVVVEALDRLSRDQADVAELYKLLSFVEVRILSLAEGEISELHIGLKGTMNALFLKDLADKTRRGLSGRIEAGRAAGGRCYGYRLVEGDKGAREIEPTEAEVVRRIFADYAAGQSPRAIAARFNAERIPAPRSGGKWNASTIAGNRRRGTGILNNALYAGRLVWNRQRFVKDPATGRRQARPNPESAWQVAEVPELRIVPTELWQAKEDLQAALEALPASHAKRPKRLLSGLLHCHLCGGPMAIAGPARYGCTNFRESGTCGNNRSISARKLERRVLDGLKDKLLSPEAMAAAVKAFHLALQRATKEKAEGQRAAVRELGKIEKQIAGMIAAIKDGLYDPAMKSELAALRCRQAELERETAAEPSAVIDFHPDLPGLYRQRISDLQAALDQDADRRQRAIIILRDLIDRIVVVFGEDRGEFSVQIEGRLAAILALAHDQDQDPKKKSMGTLVAGAGFEPATFRL